jgi:sugar fermentation stimulation protein
MERKVSIEFNPALKKARFVERINRFLASVEIDGKQENAHVPSSGRLRELLMQGAEVWVQPASNPDRRTRWSIRAVRAENGTLVSIDTGVTNKLVKSALQRGLIEPFDDCSKVQPEARYHNSRLDFQLDCHGAQAWIEVKSVTLVVDGVALFPDAPTERGRKHLSELERIASAGGSASVIFIIQRNDAHQFAPNRGQDPEFASALVKAAQAGVTGLAFACEVTQKSIVADFSKCLPVDIHPTG